MRISDWSSDVCSSDLPEATVEEITGIGRHAGFDAVLDDKDDDAIQVVCRRADGTEVPLANPARAFFFGDRILYTEEARRFDLGEKQQTLNINTFPRNERRFDELKRACQRSEEHTSDLQSLMRISYALFFL